MMIQGRKSGFKILWEIQMHHKQPLTYWLSNDSVFPASDDSRLQYTLPQAPVVQTLDSAIHQINHYLADKY